MLMIVMIVMKTRSIMSMAITFLTTVIMLLITITE